ncbi:hypothetical protein GALMADRAFT_48323, partial [Galerina marginata CBS 339.88]
LSIDTIKAKALEHFMSNGKIVFAGHSEKPCSIFKNPQLFPSMLPWLFPYGHGGIGQSIMNKIHSPLVQKRHLLMYHDKRFQTDPNFPLIAFNHEQISQSTSRGRLVVQRSYFSEMANRLLNINHSVLSNIS